MNISIKNKLKELVGKNVDFFPHSAQIYVSYPGESETILRIENDDCLVIKNNKLQIEIYIPISNISFVEFRLATR